MEKRLKPVVIPCNALLYNFMGPCDRFFGRVKCQPHGHHLAVPSYNNLKNFPVFV